MGDVTYLNFFGLWELDFSWGRGYRFRLQKDFLNFSGVFGNSGSAESHRNRAFQKEQDLSFSEHLKFLKSVNYQESYTR